METADIVIIGGGILGANIAYQLARRGARKIVVLERDTLASGSSGRATGGLRQQFADELDIRFSIEGIKFYEEFTREQLDERPAFYQYGYLFLVTQQTSWQEMQRHVALQQALGVPSVLLTPAEIQERVPQLVLTDVIGASFCPSDGYSDPGAMARALFKEAQRLGVTLYEHAPVTEIILDHERVQAVKTPTETFATRLVINAAGAYAALLARLVGIDDFPVYPLRRQLYLTEPFDNLPQDVPMVVDLHTGFHFRRRQERVILTQPLPISPEDELLSRQLAPEAFELPTDDAFWSDVKEQIQLRCPALLAARIERCWSGLYEMTPDEHPILGPTQIEGFLCACGFSGHGFMHAPPAARMLAELILGKQTTTPAIEPFQLDRFQKGKLLHTTRLL